MRQQEDRAKIADEFCCESREKKGAPCPRSSHAMTCRAMPCHATPMVGSSGRPSCFGSVTFEYVLAFRGLSLREASRHVCRRRLAATDPTDRKRKERGRSGPAPPHSDRYRSSRQQIYLGCWLPDRTRARSRERRQARRGVKSGRGARQNGRAPIATSSFLRHYCRPGERLGELSPVGFLRRRLRPRPAESPDHRLFAPSKQLPLSLSLVESFWVEHS